MKEPRRNKHRSTKHGEAESQIAIEFVRTRFRKSFSRKTRTKKKIQPRLPQKET